MPQSKITVSWNELQTPDVEQRMQRRAAAVATREHYDRQMAQEPDPTASRPLARLRYNPVVYMALFGLLGALLGWGGGQWVYRSNPATQAQELAATANKTMALYNAGRISSDQVKSTLATIQNIGQSNAYFRVLDDNSISPSRQQALLERQQQLQFIRDILFYGICGMVISASMAMAESLVGRNYPGAVIYGSAGLVVGLIGGIIAALLLRQVGHVVIDLDWIQPAHRAAAARSATWVVLGMFLTLGPGLVLRSPKRLLIGLAGGGIGGLIGGLLYQPIVGWSGSERIAILAALSIVALIGGGATGWIENAAKTGWLKVTQGWIAGKQFILYRDPTYIGAAANCEIYLFNDSRVGRRSAAIRRIPGGYELEDLPLGEPTLVNGRPIGRQRLVAGDSIRVGGTEFVFLENDNIE